MESQGSPQLVVGITGASGAIYGVRILEVLRSMSVETHLVITDPARITIRVETERTLQEVQALAAHTYTPEDFAAPIASGSCATAGMVVAPCSIKTLSAIAQSHADNLLVRAADVTLKEGRPLLLVVRETPLHVGHLRLMVRAAENGAIIFPPVPAFYAHPQTLEELVDHTVGRILARLGFPNTLYRPWPGLA
ncbi:MAG: 3-octaprenyl-4-hydroxybenzoate carboxy-lyase [Chloroflexi bacterium]|nr:MAG: 3-octaprenyl-4-hydroxybenzoate carboxy-lyase [Chloroflexota bacterium]